MVSKDYLAPQLKELPYFRALLRSVEARFYENIELPRPILDLGCGDGSFASHAFSQAPEVGLDPWTGPLRAAAELRYYSILVQADGATMPFPNSYFSSAVSNSVLEHIPHLDQVLKETARILKPDARFIFCVPNHRFLENLSVGQFFDKLRLPWLSERYRSFFNRISRHHHCDSPDTWIPRLANAGFEVVKWWDYFSRDALHVLEWGHYFGLPSAILHMLTKRWIIAPSHWNLALTDKLVRRFYEEPAEQPSGVYSFYIARRM